jgi:uncharacterized protein YjiK
MRSSESKSTNTHGPAGRFIPGSILPTFRLLVTVLALTFTGLIACARPSSDDPLPSEGLETSKLDRTIDTTNIRQPAPLSLRSNQPARRLRDAYQFDAPDAALELDKSLREISGLTVIDEAHLGVIQDEKGKVYKIRIEDGEIIGEERFEDDGDYEDIERVGEIYYVLRSDGDLFETGDWPLKEKDTRKHETWLSAKFDTEGLAYDPAGKRLLIACKEFPGDHLKGTRTVYAFDLATKKLGPEPVYVIRTDQIEAAAPDHPLNQAIRKLAAPLFDLNDFKPSAIALHPRTGHLFVVSSVRKLLVALNSESEMEAIWELPEKLFPQPEGIAFLPNGDLMISNEGGGNHATLLRYNYRN